MASGQRKVLSFTGLAVEEKNDCDVHCKREDFVVLQ